MPMLYEIKCNKCGHLFQSGSGGYLYVVDQEGVRRVLPHPVEISHLSEILGIDRMKAEEMLSAMNDHRLGYNSEIYCLNCRDYFHLDTKKDEMICPSCKSQKIIRTMDLAGKSCPICKEGIIEAIRKGIS
jgi:predicted Zn-ribbon and HTH transcriptional regulator